MFYCFFINVFSQEKDSLILLNADEKKLVEVGKIAPDFKSINNFNDSVSLKDYRGKYVLLNIWQTSCGPCIENIPNVDSLLRCYNNLIVFNICTDEDSTRWLQIIKSKNFKGIHLRFDEYDIPIKYYILNKYKYKNKEGAIIGTIYPHYVLIDKSGKIIYNNSSNINPKNWKRFNEILKN